MMTPQEVWWKTYFSAVAGIMANSNSNRDELDAWAVVDLAEAVADKTIARLVTGEVPYDPAP